MAFPGSPALLNRPRLLAALSVSAPLVVLVGPSGAGASTLLRQWAEWYVEVTWGASGSIPTAPADALILDRADELTEHDWTQIRALLIERPELPIRAAVHSRDAVPDAVGAEFVGGLLFTMQETNEYLALRGSSLDHRAVQLATDGLPAAVRTVVDLKTVRPTLVHGALKTLRTGTLPEADAELAIPDVLTQEVVLGLGGSADFIDRAERAGFGLWQPAEGHPLFVLTAPVRAATREAHPAADAPAVRDEAARILLEQGAWFGALVEGAARSSLSVVDAALKGGGMTLLRVHGAAIAARLSGIRDLELRRWPVIAMAHALILNARQEHRLRAVELMGVALLGARTAPSGSAERALLRAIESVARRLLGIGDGGARAALAAGAILDELPESEQRSIDGLLGDLHTHAAVSLLYDGQDAEAIARFERALATSLRPETQLIAFGGIAVIHALSGDLDAGRNWVEAALRRPWPESIQNEYQGSLLRIAQAKLFVEQGRIDEAEDAIATVWHIIDTIEHWPLLAHLQATIDICRDRPGEGLERVQALRRRRGARLTRRQGRLLDLTESSLAVAAGDLTTARRLTAHTGDAAMVVIGAARAELFDGNHERALRILGTIDATAPEPRAHVAVLEGLALSRLSRPAAADIAARRASTIAAANGLLTPFLLIPADDRTLFGVDVPWTVSALGSSVAAPRLTERERVILEELLATSSVTEIATRLHVSANTVKSQRRTLYRKLGASSREDALAIAFGHGLLSGARRTSSRP